jgi:hypothetical protein
MSRGLSIRVETNSRSGNLMPPPPLGPDVRAPHIPIMPPLRPRHIPALLLRRASESRPPATGAEDYDVIGKDGEVVGRIMKTGTGPAGMPWMWSLAARRDGEGPVLGYEATREAAMEAFAKSWRPGEQGT